MSAPDWLIVKRINEVSIPKEYFKIDMDEWPKLAHERINKFIQKINWFPSEGAYRTNYEKEIYEEYAGHGLLRLIAAEDLRVKGWLIEQEGDLFEWRFLHAKTTETKIEVAKYLWGNNNVIDPRELWNKYDINLKLFKEFKAGTRQTGVIAVHFTCVPKLVNSHSALVHNGWVFSFINEFTSSLKSTFEQLLNERIKETYENLDRAVRSSIQEPITKLKEELSKIVHTMSVFATRFELEDYQLFNRQSIFPQCMLDLYNEVMSHGHITHIERLQLGLYLKNIGMPVEEQLYFWYQKAVDNIGLSFEQFTNGPAGYQIRYLYGLEGGGTDYSAHKCSTLQDDSYCTFLSQSVKTIEENLRKEFRTPSEFQEGLIRELLRSVIDKKPSEACALMFQLRYKKRRYPTKHPIAYTRNAAKVLNILKEEEDEKGKNMLIKE